LAQDDFWEKLLLDGKAELELIAKNLLPDSEGANRNHCLAEEIVASIDPAQVAPAE
jgi:hypothetical protein